MENYTLLLSFYCNWCKKNRPQCIIQKQRKPLEIKEFLLYQYLSSFMVEAVGIEPTSENTSTRVSPSAVSNLTFPPLDPYWQDPSFSSFIDSVPYSKLCKARFPTRLAPYPKAWDSRVGRAALIKQQMRNLRLRLI